MSRLACEAPRFAVVATAVSLATVLVSAAEVSACAVCYGDPESPMTKAVVAGVWVLLGCIGTLLMSFAGLFMYWMQRSKRLPSLEPSSGGTTH